MRVGVKNLKNSLSHYLRLVKAGEVVYVAEHSRIVAELRPARTPHTRDDAALVRLEELGLLSRGEGVLEDFEPLRIRTGRSLTETVLRDRR